MRRNGVVIAAVVCLMACGGADGAPGASGKDGANGQTGSNGSNGAPGAPGSQGDTGPRGAQADAGTPPSAAPKPTHAPQAIDFFDIDPELGVVAGVVTIHKAADESDVTSYAVYYGTTATDKLYLTPIVVAPATGSDVRYPLTLDPPPPGATSLIAYSQNAAGEMTNGIATAIHDGVPAAVDISVTQGMGSGQFQTFVIDDVNGKVLVVSGDASNLGKPSLFRCNLDGTSCTWTDISSGQGTLSGINPSIAIDHANQKLLVVTEDGSNSNKPSLFRCNLDGTACTWTDISSGQGANSGTTPSIAIDAANGKLLVVTEDLSAAGGPSLFRCNLDGTSCARTDISTGQAGVTGVTPSLVLDTVNGKLLVVTDDQAGANKPALFRCNLDGTSCSFADISAGQGTGSGKLPSATVDSIHGQLLVTTSDQSSSTKPSLFRCALDGTSCVHVDISAGKGANSGEDALAAVDPINGKLLVALQDGSNGNKLTLVRCDSDGTGCAAFDMSAGLGGGSGITPMLRVDPTTGRFFMVSTNGASSNKPELFFLR